jgi:hypothetical protein
LGIGIGKVLTLLGNILGMTGYIFLKGKAVDIFFNQIERERQNCWSTFHG